MRAAQRRRLHAFWHQGARIDRLSVDGCCRATPAPQLNHHPRPAGGVVPAAPRVSSSLGSYPRPRRRAEPRNNFAPCAGPPMPDAPPPTPPAKAQTWSPGATLQATFPGSDSEQRKPPTSRRSADDASAVCNIDMESIGDAPQDASPGHMADADAAAPGAPSCDAGSAETPRGAGRPAEPTQPATSRKRSGSNGPQRGPPDAAKKQKPDGRDAKRDLESETGAASEPKRQRQEDAEGD